MRKLAIYNIGLTSETRDESYYCSSHLCRSKHNKIGDGITVIGGDSYSSLKLDLTSSQNLENC